MNDKQTPTEQRNSLKAALAALLDATQDARDAGAITTPAKASPEWEQWLHALRNGRDALRSVG